jgi:parallel beta-helix repeat protein
VKKIAYILMAAVGLTMTAFGFDTSVSVPATEITSLPITISTPGKYYLTSNLAAVGTNWNIVITASNVVLDLDGQVITGAANQFGILIDGASGVTVKNGGAARGLLYGVFLLNATDCTVENVAAATEGTCITDVNGKGNRIVDCNVSSEPPHVAWGIYLTNCTGDLVSRNLIRRCNWGVVSSPSGGNSIRANNINCPHGLLLSPTDSYEENIFAGSPSVTVSGGVHSTD